MPVFVYKGSIEIKQHKTIINENIYCKTKKTMLKYYQQICGFPPRRADFANRGKGQIFYIIFPVLYIVCTWFIHYNQHINLLSKEK